MIAVCCSALPHRASKESLLENVQTAFPSKRNAAYTDRIARRSEPSSREGLFALVLLADVIKKHFSSTLELGQAVLLREAYGKPYFENRKIYFSISHSNGSVAVAVSDEDEIGIDIETADIPSDKAIKLAKRFFKDNESELCPDGFLRVWTKKEAAAKLWGIPLAEYLGDIKDDGKVFFSEFEFGGSPVTVCTHTKADNITFYTI